MSNLKQRLLHSGQNGALLEGLKRSVDAGMYPIEIPERGFSQQEITLATISRMTGPKATRPSFRAVRKTVLRMRKGLDITKGSWRDWPSVDKKEYA